MSKSYFLYFSPSSSNKFSICVNTLESYPCSLYLSSEKSETEDVYIWYLPITLWLYTMSVTCITAHVKQCPNAMLMNSTNDERMNSTNDIHMNTRIMSWTVPYLWTGPSRAWASLIKVTVEGYFHQNFYSNKLWRIQRVSWSCTNKLSAISQIIRVELYNSRFLFVYKTFLLLLLSMSDFSFLVLIFTWSLDPPLQRLSCPAHCLLRVKLFSLLSSVSTLACL
jgi:hypothetical protein